LFFTNGKRRVVLLLLASVVPLKTRLPVCVLDCDEEFELNPDRAAQIVDKLILFIDSL
jgi:hypothetical protein